MRHTEKKKKEYFSKAVLKLVEQTSILWCKLKNVL